MGDLSLNDFQVEISAGLGNRREISIGRIVTAINLAQGRIARSYDFSELASVQFAQMNFTGDPALDKYLVPPPRIKTLHSFVVLDTSAGPSSLGQSKKVVEKPWRWFDRRFPAPEFIPAGWPSIYARWGNIIVMVPSPFLQFTAQLRLTKYPLKFTSSALTQVSDFENKDDILICYALGYFFKTLGRNDRAVYFEGLAKEQLDEAIERDDTRPDMEISRDTTDMGMTTSGPYWANPFVESVR
jgi:hypothetical protein